VDAILLEPFCLGFVHKDIGLMRLAIMRVVLIRQIISILVIGVVSNYENDNESKYEINVKIGERYVSII